MKIECGLPKRDFTVVVEKDEDGYFFAYVPELYACQTQARTMEELQDRIKEAIELCLEVNRNDTNVSPEGRKHM